jgi:hypothetical protein
MNSPLTIALKAPGETALQSMLTRCDHCEEEFSPDELVILAPPSGQGDLICARCIEIKLRRAIAELPREN